MSFATVLLPSVLLGPQVWADVRDILIGAGHRTVIADTHGVTTPAQAVEAYLAAVPTNGPTILVPHSNAGLYIPPPATHGRPQLCGRSRPARDYGTIGPHADNAPPVAMPWERSPGGGHTPPSCFASPCPALPCRGDHSRRRTAAPDLP
jgi:hypothetical protein